MQFNPLQSSGQTISVWVNDISRSGNFVFMNSDTATYDGLEMINYQIDPTMMLNRTVNKDNAMFNTYISGTSNMSTVLGAPVLASKGHFYEISEELKEKGILALMVNSTGDLIEPVPEDDDIFLGVESMTGVNLQAKQRIQMNFYVTKDMLFSHLESDYLIPLTLVKRESTMTSDQVHNMMGALFAAKIAKPVGISVLITIGGLLVILSIFLLIKYKKVKRLEELGIGESPNYQ